MGNNTYRIAMSRRLDQCAEASFHIVEDLERFPEFMPNVESIEVQSIEGNRKIAAWHTTIDDAPLEWIEEGIYDRERMRVEFRALDGVFERFDGFWQVVPDGDGSRVTFELSYELGLPEIDDIVGPLLKERLVENAEYMLEALRRRAEADT